MSFYDFLLLFLRAFRRRVLTTRLNCRVRVLLPAPFSWRNHMATRVLASAGATVAEIDLKPTRDDGTPGLLDGPVSFSSAPQYTIHVHDTGLAADVIATGATGAVVITVSADGDLGSGVSTVSQDLPFEFVAQSVPLTTHLNASVLNLLPAPEATPPAPVGA